MVNQLLQWAGRIMVAGCVVLVTAAQVSAQQVEASFEGGYTTSEGVNATQNRVVLGQVYNSLDITSGGSFGVTAGAFLGHNWELEFLWHRQFSTLEISNPAPALKLADQNVDNFHGNFVYNFGASDSHMRPFAFFGLGATHYSPGDYGSSIPGGGTLAHIESVTRFSSTWGGGVKAYPGRNIGVRGTVRWTPTYIKSEASGLWCDPFYATCWVVGDADYSHQFEFSGGVTFRFGGFD